jgi:DNA repair exonuclease SbcCD ATPase subunit
MKREDIKTIFPEATDEQLKQVMDLHGNDVEKAKAKAVTLESDLKESKQAYETLNKELEALKESNASSEEWQKKFEALQAENEAKAKQAEADRILKEKQENILNRFNSVVGDRKFSHGAVQADYLKKFGEALENPEYQGKSDADVLHALTKDDANAFLGVQAVKLAGGRPTGVNNSKYSSKEEIMAIKDGNVRRAEMLAHPQYFPELND